MVFPKSQRITIKCNNKREQHKARAWFLLVISQFLSQQSPSTLCWKCIHDSHVAINHCVTADFMLPRVKIHRTQPWINLPFNWRVHVSVCLCVFLSVCACLSAAKVASSKLTFLPGLLSEAPVAIVYCKRNSRGRPCRAERRSPSAELSPRTVHLPWFCSWPRSPWTGSPTPRPGPGLHWTIPPSRSPGPPCSPPGSPEPFRTCGPRQMQPWELLLRNVIGAVEQFFAVNWASALAWGI